MIQLKSPILSYFRRKEVTRQLLQGHQSHKVLFEDSQLSFSDKVYNSYAQNLPIFFTKTGGVIHPQVPINRETKLFWSLQNTFMSILFRKSIQTHGFRRTKRYIHIYSLFMHSYLTRALSTYASNSSILFSFYKDIQKCTLVPRVSWELSSCWDTKIYLFSLSLLLHIIEDS